MIMVEPEVNLGVLVLFVDNWKELIEKQPYSVTARIPVRANPIISARMARITPKMPKLK
jgi:hypothetical protein